MPMTTLWLPAEDLIVSRLIEHPPGTLIIWPPEYSGAPNTTLGIRFDAQIPEDNSDRQYVLFITGMPWEETDASRGGALRIGGAWTITVEVDPSSALGRRADIIFGSAYGRVAATQNGLRLVATVGADYHRAYGLPIDLTTWSYDSSVARDHNPTWFGAWRLRIAAMGYEAQYIYFDRRPQS
jgi:hypothetical protein